MNNPLVTVVVLNLNGKEFLEKCLNSLNENQYKNREVIVVDNGSTDGSQAFVKAAFPSIKLLQNKTNLGFGEGNNVGIRNSTGDFVFLLNNDVTLEKDCIGILVQKMRENPNAGITGGKIFAGQLGNVLQYAGGKIDPSGSGLLTGYLETDKGQYDSEKEVDWVHGAALFVRKTVFQTIGLFDPIYYPIYHDEVDLCYRAKSAGFHIHYVPTARIYHYEDMKSIKIYKTAFFRIRNTLIFAFKFYSLPHIILLPFFHLKIIMNGLKSPKYRSAPKSKAVDLIKAYFKATLWIIRFMPDIVKHRNQSKCSGKVSI